MTPEFTYIGIGFAGGLVGILVILGVYKISTMERRTSEITYHQDSHRKTSRELYDDFINSHDNNHLRAVHTYGGKRKTKRNKKSSKRV